MNQSVKPVRPFKRFGAYKMADTGQDPQGSYKHFVSKDPIQNIDVHRDLLKKITVEQSVKIPIGQVPYGTTLNTYKMGLNLDAKLDRESLGIKTKYFPRNPTDNLSFEPPEQSRRF